MPTTNTTGRPAATLAHAAATYVQAGWPVFPLQPGTKIPHKGTRGFKDATRDLARVNSWWSKHPDDNIGTPTGEVIEVLDIDVRAEGDGFENLDRLVKAGLARGAIARAQTRNGGEQWIYPAADPAQPTTSLKGLYIDLKCAGGYVVLPPSKVPADEGIDAPGAYSWLEFDTTTKGLPLDVEAIRDFLKPRVHPNKTHTTPSSGSNGTVSGLLNRLSTETEGNRNNLLFWAAKKAASEGHDLDDLAQTAIRIGLSPSEVAATIASAHRAVAG